MGYYVKPRPGKQSLPHWKVQFISFKRDDTKNSKAKKPKREWDIPRSRWASLGFHSYMTREDAVARAKQLNAQEKLKRQEEHIKKRQELAQQTRLQSASMLPSEFVSEFESRFIRERDSQTEQGLRKTTRSQTRWRAAQRLIIAIGVEPSEWFYHTDRFYDYFYHHKTSINYLNSILKIANLWGFYFCRKLACPFLPVPNPKGYERKRIIEANYEKKGVSRASKAIKPQELDKLRSALNKENFNWIFISVWFGLRPKEIDFLVHRESWRIENLDNGKRVLWIYQTKIISLPPEDRWKPIPIIYSEQEFALRMIQSGEFKRPYPKTLRKHFGVSVTTYGGRKGFTDLMLSRGQSIENISVWMGHSTIQRTWRSYKDRKRYHLVGF